MTTREKYGTERARRRAAGRTRTGVVAFLLLLGCSRGDAETAAATALQAPAPARAGDARDSAAATITARDIKARIGFLASDMLRGRATPSPGLEIAARYIASEFAMLGLEPGGDDSTYLQWYAVTGAPGRGRAPNVVGILRGSDARLRDTYVVFGAHMDHVGVGAPDTRGDSIYNGADDNASGTSAVLELAQAFASLPARPARSIIFLTVSGEEIGLFGSQAFVEHGRIPMDRIVADINIDMIGRNAPDTVVAIGMRYSDMGSRVLQTAGTHPELGLAVIDDPWPDERFFFRSDHYNFARAGIPALFFFSGVHADYHRPSDEVDKINGDKAARIARLAFWLGLGVADDRNAPKWTRDGIAEVHPRRIR